MALNEFRSICLPYCLKKQKDGGYLVLNREYKPLGFNTLDEIKYEDYPISTKYAGITSKKASMLSWNSSTDTENIFLYNDGTVPTSNKKNMGLYLAKLEILAKLQVKRK